MASVDMSSMIPSLSQAANAGLDPDELLASGDPHGMLAAKLSGVPYVPKQLAQSTGISNPPDGGNVRSISPIGAVQPPSAPPTAAVPSTVSPSGTAKSAFGDIARQALQQKMGVLTQAQNTPQGADVNALESRRAALTPPNAADAQYQPSVGRRIARGLEGVGLGLAEGGLRGAIAGGIAPQTTGLSGYRDPNSKFAAAQQQNQQQTADLDQQIAQGNTAAKQREGDVQNLTRIGAGLGSTATEAAESENAEHPNKGKAQIITAGDGSLFSVDPDDPSHPTPVVGADGKPLTGKTDSKYIPLEVNGQEHTFEVKPNGSKVDMGPTGQKPIRISTGGEGTWSLQEQKDDKGATKTVLFNSKTGATKDAPAGLQKSGSTGKGEASTFKAYTPALDSAERMNIMTQNAEDALKGNQQAGLSLLSNHIGMTMGLVKGARINKEIYKEAEQSQPWLQGVKAHFDSDGYLSGVALSPPQIGNMVDLAPGRMSQDIVKARNESKYLGSTDDGPDRTPSRSTMRYYLFKSGGDKDKAKAAAAADGWTVTNASK